MIEVQVKDFCFLCNGNGSTDASFMCVPCNGQGEIFNWITIEKLSEMVADIQFQKTARFEFPEKELNIFKPEEFKELEIQPNPNI